MHAGSESSKSLKVIAVGHQQIDIKINILQQPGTYICRLIGVDTIKNNRQIKIAICGRITPDPRSERDHPLWMSGGDKSLHGLCDL